MTCSNDLPHAGVQAGWGHQSPQRTPEVQCTQQCLNLDSYITIQVLGLECSGILSPAPGDYRQALLDLGFWSFALQLLFNLHGSN